MKFFLFGTYAIQRQKEILLPYAKFLLQNKTVKKYQKEYKSTFFSHESECDKAESRAANAAVRHD